MRYMGINNIEDYLAHILYEFQKNNYNRRIIKILVPEDDFHELRKIAEEYQCHTYKKIEYWSLIWNNIPIEYRDGLRTVILVPEGSLAEALYE